MGWTWHLSKEPNLPHTVVQNSIMARASVDLGQGLDVVQTVFSDLQVSLDFH